MQHKKVYNVFQINLIVFYILCLMIVPIFAIVSFIFDLQLFTTNNTIILIAAIIMLITFAVGMVYLLATKEQFERKLKPSYQREFTFIMAITALGVLGLGILFLYVGGSTQYIPHVIIPVGILAFGGLYLLGKRYFNVSLVTRKKR